MTTTSNGKPSGWIHDGYTRTAFIAADPGGLFPDVSFSYRPMLVQHQAVVYAEMEKVDAKRRQAIAADALRMRIISWNMEGISHDKTDDILKIQPKLFNRMFDIVMGYDGGDRDPDADSEISNTQQSLSDALRGSDTVSLKEEAAIKN